MDAVDILKICFRRWYVMLPILLGAAGVSYQLVQSQETTYTAATSYGLVQPRLPASTELGERNPLGTDDSALVGAALEAQLNSRETQLQLGSDATQGWGPGESENGSSYSVKIPQFETTYEVRAWGTDEEEVAGVVNRVIEAAPEIADELQTRAGAPTAVRYEPFVLAPTQVDALPPTSGLKLMIAVMGVGVLVGAAWSIVADRLLRRRRPRSRSAPDTDGASAPARTPAERRTPAGGKPANAANAAKAAKPAKPANATKPVKPVKAAKPGKAGSPGSPPRPAASSAGAVVGSEHTSGPTSAPGEPSEPAVTSSEKVKVAGNAAQPAAGARPDRRHQPLVRR